MRVLLTNDDGIAAPGLQALRRKLVAEQGLEVVTIAPDAPLREAVSALSRHDVTHLLVCRDGDVAAEGVVTALDILAAWER